MAAALPIHNVSSGQARRSWQQGTRVSSELQARAEEVLRDAAS